MIDPGGIEGEQDVSADTGVERLELVASAIAARHLSVVALDGDELSWTDGTTVFIDGALSPADRLVAVSVQAALLASGSLDVDLLAGLDRRRSTVERYLAVEGHRALLAQQHLIPPAALAVADRRVADLADDAVASLDIARGREPLALAPPVFGAIRPRHIRAERVADEPSDSVGHVPRTSREQTMRELDDGEDVAVDGGFDTLNPIGGGGALGKFLQRFLGSSRSKGSGSPGADAATHRSGRGGRVGRGSTRSSVQVDLTDDADVFGRRGQATYPEWNVFQHRYRDEWCTVTEGEADGADGELRIATNPHDLRRSLARLGLDLERSRRQDQGPELDLDALIEARVDAAAGLAPHDAIYVDSLRRRRELSVLVLLDISGSGREPSPGGATVHDHHVAAASALTAALAELGDRVALYGFRSQGRTAVEVNPLKRFDDRFDERARRRLAATQPAAYTRLGAAIRHGAAVLEDEGGTVRRLLVVISDGFAYDHGYEGPYAEADARRALAEARRRGTACLCLTIGAGTDADTLRRVFGTAAYAGFARADDLARSAGPLFLSALRLAEQQRRTSQRDERTRERLLVQQRRSA